MNVTSMLSNGYLLPALRPWRTDKNVGESAALSMQEQRVLAQEQALKTVSGPGAEVSTTYRYTVGPDGRRYITGAEVAVKGDEQTVDRVGGGVKRVSLSEKSGSGPVDTEKNSAPSDKPESEAKAVRELEAIEREVIAHEAAHKAAGGRFAGAVSYSYTMGPDGKSYITGGEVPIHVPVSNDPEQTLRNMEQVQRAALAPGTPSGQDMGVAAQAGAAAAQARQELFSKTQNDKDKGEGPLKEGISSVRAGLRYERIQAEYEAPKELFSPANPAEVYGRVASKHGLWSLDRGFDASRPPSSREPNFELAA